jgi:hypothetical protein
MLPSDLATSARFNDASRNELILQIATDILQSAITLFYEQFVKDVTSWESPLQ